MTTTAVYLVDVKTTNGWTIKERTGAAVRAERLPRYVAERDGRIVEEFRRLASAEKWCRENDSRGSFEGEVETCCHRVAVRYWGFASELTPELQERLLEEGEERAKHCIIDGCSSGQLFCYWSGDAGDEQICGWWEIIRD